MAESALRQYEYGGEGLFGFLMPERREILSPEQQLLQGYESTRRGPAAVIETIPARYGEPEVSFEYTPVVRGIRSALNAVQDLFTSPPTVEQAKEAGKSALRGIDQYMRDQYTAGALGGTAYNPETGQVTEFDPTVAMVGGAPAGVQAVRAATPGSVVLGMVGSKNARYTPDQLEAIRQIDEAGFDTDRLFLHGTSDEIDQLSIGKTQKRDSGYIGTGAYSTPEPRISGGYANLATPTTRDNMGDWAGPNTFPLITKKGNYKQYTLKEKTELGQKARANPEFSRQLAEQNIAEGYIGADVVDADGSIIERVNYFPDTDTRSAFDYSIPETTLRSGSRRGTGVALGSALSPSKVGFDPSYEKRVGELNKIGGMEFQYSGEPPVPKEVSIFDFEGRPFVTSMSDRSMAGTALSGIGDVKFDIPVELLGGQGYMFGNPGELWAAAKTPASSIYRTGELAANRAALGGVTSTPLYIPYRMGATGSDFSHMTTDAMLTYARNNMSASTIKNANKDIKEIIPEWKGIENPESMVQLSNVADSTRAKVRNLLDKKYRDEGGIGVGTARLAISDPSQYQGITGGIQNIGEFDLSSGIFPSSHRSYPYAIPGQGLGALKETDINVYELMPELAAFRGIDVTQPIPQSEMYTLQTGIKGAPGQIDPTGKARPFTGIITESALRAIEDRRR